jgi:hypothetical protein
MVPTSCSHSFENIVQALGLANAKFKDGKLAGAKRSKKFFPPTF